MADHGTVIGPRKFLRLAENMEDKTVKGWKSLKESLNKVWKRIDTERKNKENETIVGGIHWILFSGGQICLQNIKFPGGLVA